MLLASLVLGLSLFQTPCRYCVRVPEDPVQLQPVKKTEPMPGEVKIGPFPYKVELVKGPITTCKAQPGWVVYGCTQAPYLRIQILAGTPAEHQKAVLIHELTHAMADFVGRANEGSDMDDEDFAESMSATWLMVLEDNPRLVLYLFEK